MITPRQLQIAWIAYLKTLPATIAPVPVVEVREASWKGTAFTYPNIRVKVVDTLPGVGPCVTTGNTILEIFSEQKSSNEGDLVAGNLAAYLHEKKMTFAGIKFTSILVERVTGAEPATEDQLTWKSTVEIQTLMS